MRVVAAVLAACAIGQAAAAHAQDARRPQIDITVRRADLSFSELQRLVPALERVTLPGDFRVERLQASGPLTSLTLRFLLRSDVSRIEGTVSGDLTGPQRSVQGQVRLRSVNLARLLQREALPTSLTAATTFDLRIDTAGPVPSLRGTWSVNADRVSVAGYTARNVDAAGRLDGQTVRIERLDAAAYGGTVTAEGRVGLPLGTRPFTYALEGRAAGIDLEQLPDELPVPELPSALDFSYAVSNTGEGPTGRIRFARSEIADGVLTEGTVVTFDATGEEVAYTATGGVVGLDPQPIAAALGLETLADERFGGAITASFAVEGRGGTIEPLTMTITEARLFGGRILSMDVTITRIAERVRFAADGQFAGIDPGAAFGRPDLDGAMTGTLTVSGALPQALDNEEDGLDWRTLALAGTVVLTKGRVEGVPIDTLVLEGSYDDLVLRLDQLEASGPTVAAKAAGTLALDGSVPSDFAYFLNTPHLALFQDVLNRPVEGDIRLEGRITGTGVLQATGTVAGTDVGYDEVEATTLNATYRATIPPGALLAATADVTLDATFIRVAGRTFTEGVITATYANRVATFDARVQEAAQTVATTGRLLVQPGRQQVYLTTFQFQSPEAIWQMPPAAEARIEYGDDRIVVDGFRLHSAGGQRIVVEGTLGRATEDGPLEVWVDGLSLASIDGLVFGEQGITGTVNGYAAITGPLAAPTIDGRVVIDNGTVRDFQYQQFAAAVEPAGAAYRFEARLLQDAASWVTAEGTLPRTLFAPGRTGGAEEIDLAIRSSAVGLGFVGAFTDRVRNVAGTVEADVRMRGTLASPYFDGRAVVRNGTFLVPALGTTFSGMQSTVVFEPDAMVVPDFRILDENGRPLWASGRLPYERGRLGAVNIEVQSENFEIIDGELGDVQVTTLLVVTGTVLAPRLEGVVRVPAGEIRVDRILDLSGTRYYRAAPLDEAAARLQAQEDDAGLLRGLPVALAVALEMPALQLTGTDLRGPASIPIGLGDIRITVEGDVRLQKAADGPLRITGDVATVRGSYAFQGRRFEILRGGRIRFPGLVAVNPLLDITAQRVISGVETQVRIDGTLRDPALALTSNPPLDQADILSLIVFNQPANQLGAVDQISLGRRAAALAAGFVVSEFTEALGGALDLDILEIETGDDLEGLTPVLTIGEQVGERVFLRLRQGLGGGAGTQLALEVEVTDWLRLQSSVSDERSEARSLFRRSERSALRWIFFFNY